MNFKKTLIALLMTGLTATASAAVSPCPLSYAADTPAEQDDSCLYVSTADGALTVVPVAYIERQSQPSEGRLTLNLINGKRLSFKDVTIDGTYSKKDRSGYGILMNNIWNHTVDNLVGKGNWGIYGTNNVNTVLIKNSDINRFDIHCYGRDIRFENTIFRNLYNQFSSVFGVISFSSCRFIDFTPVLIEYSYNTYTPYNLILKNCVWDVTPLHYYMVYAGFVDDSENTRPELVEKCWPDVRIDGLKVNVSKGVPDVYMFFPRGTVSKTCRISHISKININNLKMSCDDAGSETAFKLTPVDIPVKNDVVIQERRSNVKLKSTFVKR